MSYFETPLSVPFGGLAVVFSGDPRQNQPYAGIALYKYLLYFWQNTDSEAECSRKLLKYELELPSNRGSAKMLKF